MYAVVALKHQVQMNKEFLVTVDFSNWLDKVESKKSQNFEKQLYNQCKVGFILYHMLNCTILECVFIYITTESEVMPKQLKLLKEIIESH